MGWLLAPDKHLVAAEKGASGRSLCAFREDTSGFGLELLVCGLQTHDYKSPRCGQIHRDDDLRWDKHEGRGDRYAVLNAGNEVLMIVATAPAF